MATCRIEMPNSGESRRLANSGTSSGGAQHPWQAILGVTSTLAPDTCSSELYGGGGICGKNTCPIKKRGSWMKCVGKQASAFWEPLVCCESPAKNHRNLLSMGHLVRIVFNGKHWFRRISKLHKPL